MITEGRGAKTTTLVTKRVIAGRGEDRKGWSPEVYPLAPPAGKAHPDFPPSSNVAPCIDTSININLANG